MLTWLTAGLVVLGGVGTLLYVVFVVNGDAAQVRRTVESFAAAVDSDDLATTVGLLCADEARDITEDDDYDPDPIDNPPAATADPGPAKVTPSEVRIRGDVAAATLTHVGGPPTTLYLRKDGGSWKVCAAAEQQFALAPPS